MTSTNESGSREVPSIPSLTPEERKKFAEWLRWEANVNAMLIQQMDKLPGMKHVADRKRQEAAIFTHVASYLESIEDVTFGY